MVSISRRRAAPADGTAAAPAAAPLLFHVELREFGHSTHVYNLTAARLHAEIVDPWAREKVFEVGEHKWVPERTTLVILEGPELPLHRLGLGRGWTNAFHASTDVTARVTGAARAALEGATTQPTRSLELQLELLTRANAAPLSLREVWQLTEAPDASAAQRLALAEQAVGDLLTRGAAELCRGHGSTAATLDGDQASAVLSSLEEWSKDDRDSVFLRAATQRSPTA